MRLVLITGLSGAGKGIALKTLEDIGFEAIDNLPLHYIPPIVATGEEGRSLAIASDIRSRDFSAELLAEVLKPLRERMGLTVKVLFLDCEDEVIRRRFTETRRRHPLTGDRPITDCIRHERDLMAPLRALADLVIDTSAMASADLRTLLSTHFSTAAKPLVVSVVSFAFRNGVPREADLLFDVRFLQNPHYDPLLRDLTGRDPRVGAHVAADPDYEAFMQRLEALVLPLLPRYREEGKHYLTIAIGCTGGQHRSVFVAEELARVIRASEFDVTVRHRDAPGD